MPMFLMSRRAPYSDWLAQVQRILDRRIQGEAALFDSCYLRGCYQCGLSPRQIADELLEGTGL